MADDIAARFRTLQQRMPELFRGVFEDRSRAQTIVVLPSLSLDQEVLSRIEGAHHYEERMLCMLLLLRMPRARIVYLSSMPIAEAVVDYCLHLLANVPGRHARDRLTMITCYDASERPLTEKLMRRPRVLERLKEAIGDPAAAHMSCFSVSPLERRLAVCLGVPIYGCDPDLLDLGSKSGSRKVFREAGILLPPGSEDLRDTDDIVEALVKLKRDDPDLGKAVVKLEDGFSGEGNALFSFDGAPAGSGDLPAFVRSHLPDLAFNHASLHWEQFESQFAEMGGIVEAFIEGAGKRSPSGQFRVDPIGKVHPVSTHDQVLGGSTGQVFLGCQFPAHEDYRLAIQSEGLKAAKVLADKGVLGRFAVDFLSVPQADGGWLHYAIEINLRKGGTTHPYLMLQLLTDGRYDPDTGLFLTRTGQTCAYVSSDNVHSDDLAGLTPDDLVDIAVYSCLHFDAAVQSGIAFHLIGALSEFGKVGVVSVGRTVEDARAIYDATLKVLDSAARPVIDRDPRRPTPPSDLADNAPPPARRGGRRQMTSA